MMTAGFVHLTKTQQEQLFRVHVRRREADRANAEASLRTAEFVTAIFEALTRGVPAKLLADELGLSTSRIYQIRDEVAAHRP